MNPDSTPNALWEDGVLPCLASQDFTNSWLPPNTGSLLKCAVGSNYGNAISKTWSVIFLHLFFVGHASTYGCKSSNVIIEIYGKPRVNQRYHANQVRIHA